jgi:hypothetical protein
MRGEMDRECRAAGGQVKKDDRKAVKKSFYSTKPKTGAVDATLKRGKGIFRKRGGKVGEYRSDEPDAMETEEKKRGGKVEGKAKKPHMGRAGRARGGAAGSDLRPLTSADKPRKAKDLHTMPEGEATP